MLWVFLVLGESMISLGLYGDTKDTDYYLTLFLGIALIYLLMRLFVLGEVS